MSDENEFYDQAETDLVDRELGIVEAIGVHEELVDAVESGLNKTWSFETLAIQAELEKEETIDPEKLWIDATLKSSFYDVEQEPEDILEGLNLTAESFRERAKSLLTTVLEFLGRILKSALAILRQCADFFVGIEAKAKRIRYWAENSRYKKVPEKAAIELGRSANKLLVGMVPVKDGSQLISALKEHQLFLQQIKAYVNHSVQIGGRLTDVVGQFDLKNPEASIERILSVYKEVNRGVAEKICSKQIKDNRFFVNKAGMLKTSVPLLGGKQFYLAVNSGGANVSEELRNAIRTKFIYQFSSSNRPAFTEAAFKPMSAEEIISAMDLVLELSAAAKSLVEEDIEKKLELINKQMTASSKKALSYFDEQSQREQRAVTELMVDTVKAFSIQSSTPILNYVSALSSTLRAVTTVGKGSLSLLR